MSGVQNIGATQAIVGSCNAQLLPRTLFNYIKGGREKLLERIAAGVEPDPRVKN